MVNFGGCMNNNNIKTNIFIIQIIFKSKKYFFPWDSDIQGLIACNNDVLFETDYELLKTNNALENRIFDNHITIYDLDKLLEGEENLYSSPDYNWFIEIWNFFSDLYSVTDQTFIGDSSKTSVSELYDKLFYGCNLLVTNNEDKRYYPKWKTEDIALLKGVMLNGVENFEKWVGNQKDGQHKGPVL